jgi:pyruvate dehydrogenase (quinone)
MPPTVTVDQIKGFSLFMIKAVLDGRGREILDLAKTNPAR